LRIDIKNLGEIAPGAAPKDAKMCFVFLSPIQRGLSATYPAPILTTFEIKEVCQCPHAYAGKNFLNFCAENFTDRKNS